MPDMEEPLWEALRAAVNLALREDGLRQQQLANRVGVGQPYLSKVLAGRRMPSERVLRELQRYVRERPGVSAGAGDRWLSDALDLAATSPDFRDLVRAALRLMKA